MQEGLHGQGGNALLETVLFIPLGVFFLTVTIDAGLAYVARSAASDSIRAARVVEGAHVQAPLLLEAIEGRGWKADEETITALSVAAANSAASSLRDGAVDDEFLIRSSVFELEIAPGTGEVQRVVQEYAPQTRGKLDYSKVAGQGLVTDREAYLQRALYDDTATYGVPRFSFDGSAGKFYDRALVLYADAIVVPRGLSRDLVTSLRGKPFVVQAQRLQSVRRPFG